MVPDEPTRLQRAEELFFEALELPVEERTAFVRERCATDEELHQMLERMLAADAAEDGFLEAPAVGSAFHVPDPESLREPAARRRIGPYELREVLGSGGIGHVWLARRADEHFKKNVAIKLIKRGMDTDAVLAAFRQERQVLARLEHPGIARLLDGGATDDGLPYLVMEYVDGVPIDRYCRERGLSLHAQLELFREVCAAVAYAHANLVVHRDLKPGNILVSSEGRVKLLDFGIARVLDPDGSGLTRSAMTRAGRLMTPEYASPEQLQGVPVTTASDVYSLGVVLYELVTARKPHSAETGGTAEFQRLVCEERPTRPSSRILRAARETDSPWPEGLAARRSRVARGDLDTIVMRALEAHPSGRYASVDQLSDDLRRFLEQRPIEARPPTWSYLARRFVQRNARIVAAAALALISVLGGWAFSTVAYVRAEDARVLADGRRIEAETAQAEAEAEARKVQAINGYLERVLLTDDPNGKLRDDVSLRGLLTEASKAVDTGTLASVPEVEAAVRSTLGQTFVHLRLSAQGEAHLRRAVELLTAIHGPEHRDVARATGRLATALCEQREYAEGVPLHRQAVDTQRRLTPEFGEALLERLWPFSTALRDSGEIAEAARVAREALAVSLRVHGPRHVATAKSHFRLGWILTLTDEPQAGIVELRTAWTIRRDLLGSDHPDCGETMLRLGRALSKQGEHEEGERLIHAAVDLLAQGLGGSHPRTSRASGHMARVLRNRGALVEAEEWYALTFERKRAYDARINLGDLLTEWARVRVKRGDRAGARHLLAEAVAEFATERTLGDDVARLADTRVVWSDTLLQDRDFAGAESQLLLCWEELEAAPVTPERARRVAMQRIVQLYETWADAHGNPAIAERAAPWRARSEER